MWKNCIPFQSKGQVTSKDSSSSSGGKKSKSKAREMEPEPEPEEDPEEFVECPKCGQFMARKELPRHDRTVHAKVVLVPCPFSKSTEYVSR